VILDFLPTFLLTGDYLSRVSYDLSFDEKDQSQGSMQPHQQQNEAE
jgi:hypothetical protein